MADFTKNTICPIIILGMHKSGTTLVSEILHASGIEMIDFIHVGGYDDGNKMERESTRKLNIELLKVDGFESVRITNNADAVKPTSEHLHKAHEIIQNNSKIGRWGFKDPRTVLTFEFWDSATGSNILIGVFRDPAEVFQHYLRRPWWRWIRVNPFYLLHAMHAWCIYNKRLLDIAAVRKDMLLIDYGELMSGDAEIERLSQFLSQTLCDRRQKSMRRAAANQSTVFSLIERWESISNGLNASEIYEQLLQIRRNQIEAAKL